MREQLRTHKVTPYMIVSLQISYSTYSETLIRYPSVCDLHTQSPSQVWLSRPCFDQPTRLLSPWIPGNQHGSGLLRPLYLSDLWQTPHSAPCFIGRFLYHRVIREILPYSQDYNYTHRLKGPWAHKSVCCFNSSLYLVWRHFPYRTLQPQISNTRK